MTTAPYDCPRPAARDALLALAVALPLTALFFWLALSHGMEVVGENALNAYFLEHGMRALWWRDYPFSFWGAPFYAPYPAALTLSDNLIGSAPIYWLFRLFCNPDRSYFLWQYACLSLTCAGLLWVMRRWGARWPMALAAAALFCFDYPRLAQFGHAQLYAAFYSPLVLHGLWRFAQQPAWRPMALVAAGLTLQLLAGIYLGWLLLLASLVFLACWFVGAPRTHLRAVAADVRRAPLAWVGVPLVCGVALALFMQPYLGALRDTGGWRFEEVVLPQVPFFADYFVRGDTSVTREVAVAQGTCALAVLAAAFALAFLRVPAQPACRRVARLSLLTFLLLTLVALRFGDFTAWKFIFDFAPGAKAIRAIGRIWTASFLFGFPAAFLILDGFLARYAARRVALAVGTALAAVTLAQSAALWMHLDPEHDVYLRLYPQERATLRRILPEGDVACVALPPAPRNVAHADLDVMWAAMDAQVPVVNGSSGAQPPHFDVNVQAVRAVDVCRNLGGAVTGRLQLVYSRGVAIDDPWLRDRTDVSWRDETGYRVATLPIPRPLAELYPTYRLGDLIGPQGTNADFVGWNDPEFIGDAQGRWSVRKTARILFWLTAGGGAERAQHTLDILLLPYGTQAYEIRVNGRAVGSGELPAGPAQRLQFALPAGLLRPEAPNEISVTTPHPKQVPPPDNRMLGVALSGLRLRTSGVAPR